MRDAHYEGAAYLQDLPPTGELPNYSEHSAELSRDVRGLRVWLPLVLHGVSAFRDALDEKLDLDRVPRRAFASTTTASRSAGIRSSPWSPSGCAGGDEDRHAKFLARINATKRVFLSETMIRRELLAAGVHRGHRTAQATGSTSASRSSVAPPTAAGLRSGPMPELPEIRALAERLDEVMAGGTLASSTCCSSRR